MAEYWGVGGNDTTGDGQTPATAWLTYSKAWQSATAGEQTILINGTTVETASTSLQADRIYDGQGKDTAILQNTATDITARFSGILTSTGNPHTFTNVTIDGQGANPSTTAIEQQAPAVQDSNGSLINVKVIAGTARGYLISNRYGEQILNNVSFEGACTSYHFITTDMSLAANSSIAMTDVDFDITSAGSGSGMASIQKDNNATFNSTLDIDGITGSIVVNAASTSVVFHVRGMTTPQLSNFDITITGDGTDIDGVKVASLSTAISTGILMDNINIFYDCPAGFGLSFGDSTTNGGETGVMENCTVTGQALPTATPHNIGFRQNSNGIGRNLKSIDGYVGILAGLVTDCLIENNETRDCNGPHIYIKGVDNATIQNNISYMAAGRIQRDNGILAVISQDATDTASADFISNEVYVSDMSNIASLAQIAADQICTFQNNIYYIADTVDLNDKMFTYGIDNGNLPTDTIVEWNARSEVTNDTIVQLPQAELDAIIDGTTGSPALTPHSSTMGLLVNAGNTGGVSLFTYANPNIATAQVTAADFWTTPKFPLRPLDVIWCQLSDGFVKLSMVTATTAEAV